MTTRRALQLLSRALLILLCLVLSGPASAQNPPREPFDHLRSGFALSGVHSRARCESCHVNGIFKGTPRDCASCHRSNTRLGRGNVVMPAQHVPTQQGCDACHRTDTFIGARFNHAGVTRGTCATCHDGSRAPGKPATHIPTGTASCDGCHASFNAWRPTAWNHTQVPVAAQCASCHTGGYAPADGRPPNHIPYQSVAAAAAANCDSCHKGGYTSWANGRFHPYVSVSTGCFACHTGSYLSAVGKPANTLHATVTGNCESCHKSTASWSSASVDHSTFNATTNCTNCHNGSTATAKPGTHIPVGTTSCLSCHNVSPAGWTPTKWNHTQVPVAAQCASCHTGGYAPADGRPPNHIPYQSVAAAAAANCDSCHKGGYTSWANGRFHPYVSVSTGCFACHTGSYLSAVGKPANTLHATVTGNCESCHKSTASWSSASVDHSTFNATTNCTNCHNGSTATAKPGTHIPVGTTSCLSCHNVSPAGWTPTKWNHTQVPVAAQCASCHTGGYAPADGRPPNHIPYQSVAAAAAANCDSCHKGGYTSWANGRFHPYVSVSTGCFACHTGSYLSAVGKPANATHATVTGSCEGCHRSTTSWTNGVTFTHSPANAVGTGRCDTCHNGSTATGKPNTHIPVSTGATKCDSCHRSQSSFSAAVTMNHSVVTATPCKACHNGSYTSQGSSGALAKPANHIPEVQLLNGAAMDCNACHTGTTSWASMRMNHNGSQGSGAGWCKACHQSGTAYLGSMERMSLTHRRATGVTDCSQSGCHRPLGSIGTAYARWH